LTLPPALEPAVQGGEAVVADRLLQAEWRLDPHFFSLIFVIGIFGATWLLWHYNKSREKCGVESCRVHASGRSEGAKALHLHGFARRATLIS
jgi:hypothetical protein